MRPLTHHLAIIHRFLQFDPPNPSLKEKSKLELALGEFQWTSIFIGTTFLNLLIIIVFNEFMTGKSLWGWFVLVLFFMLLQSAMFLYLSKEIREARIPTWWSYTTLALSSIGGAVWISLPWWLTAEPTSTQYAASLVAIFLIVVASFNAHSYSLLAVSIPSRLLIIPSALFFNTHQPIAALASFSVIAFSCINEFRLIRIRMNTIFLRHQAESLAKQLHEEKKQSEAMAYEKATLYERQRLMTDMHDGLGASLITAMSLLDNGNITVKEAAVLVRDCVDDLRLVIDSLDPVDNDLVALLAMMRYRLNSRLTLAGIKLQWEIADLPAMAWLTPTYALHFMRILQETMTNIIKHAQATRICVRAKQVDNWIEIIIEDNGKGFDINNIQPGRGLKNQKMRIIQLKGDIQIQSKPCQGTQFRLRLPLAHDDNIPSTQ